MQLETSFTNKETPGRDFRGDDHGANDSSSPEIVSSKLREGLVICLPLLYFECATKLGGVEGHFSSAMYTVMGYVH